MKWPSESLPGNGGKTIGWILFQVPATVDEYRFHLRLPTVGQATTPIYWLRQI